MQINSVLNTTKVIWKGRFIDANMDISLVSGCGPVPENVGGFRAEKFGEGATSAGDPHKEFQFQHPTYSINTGSYPPFVGREEQIGLSRYD